MQYRKIPFVRPNLRPGSSLMNGLAPAFPGLFATSPAGRAPFAPARIKPSLPRSGYGPMFPNSSFLGHVSMSKFFGEEEANNDNGIVNDFDPLFRNKETMPYSLDGLGDALPAGSTVKVMLRPQPNAPAGFPGFFAWMKSEQPAMWNYAKVALPAYTTQAEGKRTGGATLQGLGHISPSRFFGEESANNDNGIVNDVDPLFRNNEQHPYSLNGLGDDSTDDSDLSSASFNISNIDTGVISTPLPTVSIPSDTSETSSVGVSPTPSAGAVSNIVSTLTAAAPAILSDVNSQTLFNTQLARAQAGLPPLNTSAYGLSSTLTALTSGGALPLLLIGGGILAAVMLSKK